MPTCTADPFPPGAFDREDEAPDPQFYTAPRLVTHIDDGAIAFRALVMANPLWYPNLAPNVRVTLIRFITNVLDAERFHPARVDEYLS